MWQYGKLPKGWSIEKIGEYASVITDYVAGDDFLDIQIALGLKEVGF